MRLSSLTARLKPCPSQNLFLKIVPVCIVIGSLSIALGRGSAQTGNPAPTGQKSNIYAELEKAPAKAAARQNPLASDPDSVAAGGKLFELHCAECHGANADGGKKGPSLRAEEVQQAPPGALFWLLTNGVVRKGMPVWSRLPEPQRWQLVSYIKSLGGLPKPASQ